MNAPPESPPAASPRVILSGAGKSFDNGTLALAGIDLSISQHEFLSLVGPSGCGKSTLLRMIAGLVQPSAGTVSAGSVPAGGAPDIGFVFQEPTLMPWATVSDNVFLPLRLQGMSRTDARDRIDDALAMVGLTDAANTWPRELSGGMKMRVSIARALVTRPTLLLMDEPFAALDEMTRWKLNDDLLRLWSQQHWTVVFVTHSIYESAYLSTRVVVMAARPGRIVADIAMDAPCPRDAGFRLSAAYAERCRAVSAALSGVGGMHA
jgi:NitT/TauT family transport system ATP-binding protein